MERQKGRHGPLTVGEALRLGTRYLMRHGCRTARLDAELLLAYVLGMSRIDLYLNTDQPLTEAEKVEARKLLQRRARGEPVAYLTGRREFYGLRLRVTPSVLIPRPETESIVDRVLEILRKTDSCRFLVVDVGTGSGAIACAVAMNASNCHVVATDVSAEALEVAKHNVAEFGLDHRVALVQADLLAPFERSAAFDVVVSNPPYVAEDEFELMSPETRYEPHGAVYAGKDGMNVMRRLVPQAAEVLKPGGWLVLETGTPRNLTATRVLLESVGCFEPADTVLDPGGNTTGLTARRR